MLPNESSCDALQFTQELLKWNEELVGEFLGGLSGFSANRG